MCMHTCIGLSYKIDLISTAAFRHAAQFSFFLTNWAFDQSDQLLKIAYVETLETLFFFFFAELGCLSSSLALGQE